MTVPVKGMAWFKGAVRAGEMDLKSLSGLLTWFDLLRSSRWTAKTTVWVWPVLMARGTKEEEDMAEGLRAGLVIAGWFKGSQQKREKGRSRQRSQERALSVSHWSWQWEVIGVSPEGTFSSEQVSFMVSRVAGNEINIRSKDQGFSNLVKHSNNLKGF